MKLNDADIISSVRKLRKLVLVLDSIGFPLQELVQDENLEKVVAKKKMQKRIIDLSSDIHMLLQNIENNRRYKTAVKNLCSVTIRER